MATMKPYGLQSKIKGFIGKIDYHIHINAKKIENWWADYQKPNKKRARRQARLEINNEL